MTGDLATRHAAGASDLETAARNMMIESEK